MKEWRSASAPSRASLDREVRGEASVGGCVGQPLSRERKIIPGADAFVTAEGKTGGRANASARPARRGQRPWHARKLFVREPGDLLSIRGARAAGSRREGEEP